MPAVRTLEELLDVPEFGCEIATRVPSDRLRRPLSGAHSIDLARPGAWLEEGWVMLSTCGNLGADDPGAQRDLIAELNRRGVMGLGFGVGVFHDRVPPALLAAATEREFPVFEVPFGTPFRHIISSVHRGAGGDDPGSANRMVTMQLFLVDALSEPDPTTVILSRLSSLIDMDAGIAGANGGLRPFGSLPGRLDEVGRRKIAELLDRPPSDVVVLLETGEMRGFAVPIAATVGDEGRWLVLMGGRGRSPTSLAKHVARLAASVLAAVTRLDRGQRLREAADRRAVFDSLTGDATGHEERLASRHAESAGIRLDQGVCAIAIVGRAGKPLPRHYFTRLDAAFAASSTPFVGSGTVNRVRGILGAEGSVDALRAVALPLADDVTIGVGRAVRSVGDLNRSLADAAVAARVHVAAGQEPIVSYEEIDLVTACISELPLERLGSKIERAIRDLRESEAVYETLLCYFEHHLDVGRTARALRMHPNTIRYRLARVEERIGGSLRDPSTIVALHLAVLLDRSDRLAGPLVPTQIGPQPFGVSTAPDQS